MIISAVWKAFVFGLLVFAFHAVEEVIKRLIHGADTAEASSDIRLDQLAGRSILVFCTFIPLFAFREIRRVLVGEGNFFNDLLFRSEPPSRSVDRTFPITGDTFRNRASRVCSED